MPNTQTGPYPVLFAKNTSKHHISSHVSVGSTHFRLSLGPGEVGSVPWVIAKSAGFHRVWERGDFEVSDSFNFESTLDELPNIGADGGPVDWEEIEGVPREFPPEAHARSWDEVTGKPTEFPPADHTHAWGEITGKPTTFDPKIGTTATTAAAGNDSRLSDARDPKTHTHTIANVTGLQGALDGKAATGDIPTIPDPPQAAAQADSTAEDVAGLVADFNSLLAKLRTAGIIAT